MTTQPTVNYSTWALRGDDQTDWYESYANRAVFELCDAASILANVQPEYPAKLDSGRVAAISQWVEKLKENVHDLLAPGGYNQDNPLHHRLSHQKLRNWCAERGACWPIPERPADRIASLEQELAEERQLRIKAQQMADPVMSPFVQKDHSLTEPPVLKFGEPEEVYRHLDYLTADQALDWMERISGYQVKWETLWALACFHMCDVFIDCRAVRGLTYPAEGEYEHRKVFGLGICQLMNADRAQGDPLHLQGPAIHVDIYDLQEIEPQRHWWINDLEEYEVLFRPSQIERMGHIVDERGGWSCVEPIEADESPANCNGSELIERLQKLQITIDNLRDRVRYCVKFDDGQLLAELGSDLQPLIPVNSMHDTLFSDSTRDYEFEIARLNQVVAEQSAQLQASQERDSDDVECPSHELTFPYATKELEAMRTVALKYWAPYTSDKRMPTQKEIGLELCTILDLPRQSSGDPARKAIVLATAVRPDSLPDSQG